MGKKRKRALLQKGDNGAPVDAEELARRERQKKLREVALSLRATGKEYNPKKFRRLQRRGIDPLERTTATTSQTVKDGRKPRRVPQIIIVPIFWNKREDEKQMVLDVSQKAQDELRKAGLRCDTDTTHKQTPGQKFRAWEEKGVMVRVEVGPREAEAGSCLLAICKTAGEVAQKRRIEIGKELVDAAKVALGMQRGEGITEQGAREDGVHEDADGEEYPTPPADGKSGLAGADGNAARSENPDGKDEQLGAMGKLKKNDGVEHRSGDDLDGDFLGEALLSGKGEREEEAAEERAGEATGKKKKKKQKRNSSLQDNSDDGAAEKTDAWYASEGTETEKKKKRKERVVHF